MVSSFDRVLRSCGILLIFLVIGGIEYFLQGNAHESTVLEKYL